MLMNIQSFVFLGALILLSSASARAVDAPTPAAAPSPMPSVAPAAPPAKHWYDKLSLRGYTQVRYNRLLETNSLLKCDQCDKSWGQGGSFFMRRARITLSGDVHERVYVYIQPDFASENANLLQVRDMYFDLSLTPDREYRLRFGQSKVPFGWENLQSSSNRLMLDRDDAINSAAPNERDLGVAFYWAPAEIRKRFKTLVDSGLKGSGDYGVFGLAAFNGQSANKPEANDNRMMVARVAYPFLLDSGQYLEFGAQAYGQEFVVPTVSAGVGGAKSQRDARAALSAIWYPQPFGFQAEWTSGVGPTYDSTANAITNQHLSGGYVAAMWRHASESGTVIPFVRYQKYDGGKKHEQDARYYEVRDWEVGVEWQPIPAFELTAEYTISDRLTRDGTKPNNDQSGNLLRLQAQFNY
jgi:phosphate-selective porin